MSEIMSPAMKRKANAKTELVNRGIANRDLMEPINVD
jgi:hypothetical protein